MHSFSQVTGFMVLSYTVIVIQWMQQNMTKTLHFTRQFSISRGNMSPIVSSSMHGSADTPFTRGTIKVSQQGTVPSCTLYCAPGNSRQMRSIQHCRKLCCTVYHLTQQNMLKIQHSSEFSINPSHALS